MRGKIRQCVSNGKNVVCASDMKSAIDDYGGVSGCQAAHVEITNTLDDHRATGLIKGISKISNIEFQENMQITMWKAYGIGQGRNISVQGQMNSQDERLVQFTKHNNILHGICCFSCLANMPILTLIWIIDYLSMVFYSMKTMGPHFK